MEESLVNVVPQLEDKVLDDLEKQDLASYLEEVETVKDLLKTNIDVEPLKRWNIPQGKAQSITAENNKPVDVPSISGQLTREPVPMSPPIVPNVKKDQKIKKKITSQIPIRRPITSILHRK